MDQSLIKIDMEKQHETEVFLINRTGIPFHLKNRAGVRHQ